jgi:hypothetical protein
MQIKMIEYDAGDHQISSSSRISRAIDAARMLG